VKRHPKGRASLSSGWRGDVSGNVKNQDAKKNGPEFLLSHSLETLVRLAGIEPTTPWFVAKYSIQLSYSRPKHAL
jgi:hypothetical protein